MSILKNAVESIQMGVEDHLSEDPRRKLSAIRNIHAGVLLLAKEQLRRMSPEGSQDALIKKAIRIRTDANGNVTLQGQGKNTVNLQETKQRFEDLGLSFDWKPLDKISAIRNNIEHYYFEGSHDQLGSAIRDAHQLVHRLLVEILKEDPVQLLGKDCWDVLLGESAIYQEELAKCQASFEDVNWDSEQLENAADCLCCPTCRSELVRNRAGAGCDQGDLDPVCVACGAPAAVGDIVEETLSQVFGPGAYLRMKNGEPDPVERCPECGYTTYVMEDDACANCEFVLPKDSVCAVCDNRLSLDEYEEFGTLCSYHAWVASKDD